ncbi:hypothetical protein HYD97_03690 [Mycoplasmopsis bovis]|uniref:MAG0920 family protein n=1 Tax=Mycoplasmopsis bovis TaxID=28903 RepID=UPI0010C3B67E|nr:hypothetical protein [Mycoplasmopsis bovis]MBT1322982.1 hypothetical protein [Mycoplasmopsis bovis]QQH18909.1 hypothetical protein HYE49_03665 [Mycoplasmopsis bovis]QQH19134.1 hypothetical protein HYE48_03665 [Mycoplasmopsis bovis]QQH19371.1 hypothetical protein HYE47_03615 [Mycoplasmopsis bovis]QQH19580.1 hypothetical protein HYE46_03600 [Mycoplasmopsis bovis]
MEFKELFIILAILFSLHATILVLLISSKAKHFHTKITLAKKYLLKHKIRIDNIFFDEAKSILRIGLIIGILALLVNVSLIIISVLLTKHNENKTDDLFKVAILFIAIFGILDLIFFTYLIVLLVKFINWKKLNSQSSEWIELTQLFDPSVICEQVDVVHSKYTFQYSKISFSNTLDQIRDKNLNKYIYYWLVQDYDSLKVNNKIANINMFYDLYHRYIEND